MPEINLEGIETKTNVSQRLLIVDDDASMPCCWQSTFAASATSDGEGKRGEALGPALSGDFDCFIFDVTMPA